MMALTASFLSQSLKKIWSSTRWMLNRGVFVNETGPLDEDVERVQSLWWE